MVGWTIARTGEEATGIAMITDLITVIPDITITIAVITGLIAMIAGGIVGTIAGERVRR